MFSKTLYLEKIVKHLMILTYEVRAKSKLGLTDANRIAEDFYCGLLNLVYGCKLKNLNNQEQDYAGIDLGDESGSICVQVTSDNTSEKIQYTLDISKKYSYQEAYQRLVVLLINFKKDYTTTFISSFPSFTKDEIWDTHTLLKDIYAINDMARLKEIVEYLDSWLTTIIYINPIDLTAYDISSVLNLLFEFVQNEYPNSPTTKKTKFEFIKRGDDFIEQKNVLNSIAKDYFEGNVTPDLKYSSNIDQFLANPINKDSKKNYFSITTLLQKYYIDNGSIFNSLQELFKDVFEKVVTWENRSVSPQKLLIILHNMYFNCDIGNNPVSNA